MALGAVFGLTIAVMYKLNTTIAFSLGMAKYLPAILLHVMAAPFVMRSAYLELAESLSPDQPVRRPYRETEAKPVIFDQDTVPASSSPTVEPPVVSHIQTPVAENPKPSPMRHDDDNQFERAVAYIGESGSVKMALVVDEEGLPLARFSRCQEDTELWAPLAIVLEGNNRALLERYHRGGMPDKIDIGTGKMRIILRRIEHVTLMVLADKSVDETILIRIAQAADMVRKYMSERYSPALFARVEEHYVSNT
jgi:predicted regulator of Ras-like GTPase activity (Roadblock/LC7/MglB family)